jgi:short-subunit dehydrogenase
MFLVARSEEPLRKLKGEFERQVEFLAADLSDFEVSLRVFCGFRLYILVLGHLEACHKE